ncbi:MAG: hypothetical protein ABJD11_09185 [Gemmatimonadota bacterium]
MSRISFASLLLPLALLTLTGHPPAQRSNVPRCDTPEYAQFRFWVGDWTVTGAGGKTVGTNRVTLEEEGCLIHEHWEGAGGSTGQSFNFYDRSDGKWHQVWVSNDGETLFLTGSVVGNELVYTMERPAPEGKIVNHRLTFTLNADGSVHQLWQTSTDHGASWEVAFDGLYRKQSAH